MNEVRIKELRTARGWNQERLAEVSGVAVRTIQRLEAGNEASLETLALVAGALEVPVRDLFVSLENHDLSVAVDGLDSRIDVERRARASAERAQRGWFYLYFALGLAVTAAAIIMVSSPTSSGAAILVVPAYWVGGLLVVLFLRKSVFGPRLDSRFPLTTKDQGGRSYDSAE
ncbi:MAG: helix-turn-helix domain-containing protein [Nocardioides sp.]